MSKYFLQSENKTTQFFVYVGLFLFVFGLARLGDENYSFEKNQRAYYMISVAIFSLLFSFYRVQKERSLENNKNEDK